jgi:hypothetical protein
MQVPTSPVRVLNPKAASTPQTKHVWDGAIGFVGAFIAAPRGDYSESCGLLESCHGKTWYERKAR